MDYTYSQIITFSKNLWMEPPLASFFSEQNYCLITTEIPFVQIQQGAALCMDSSTDWPLLVSCFLVQRHYSL